MYLADVVWWSPMPPIYPPSLFITPKNGCPKPEQTQRGVVISEICGGFELKFYILKSFSQVPHHI